MKVSLTNNCNTQFALSNEFKEVPLFLADLEECSVVNDMLKIINEYSMFRKWVLKKTTDKRIIFDSTDKLGNIHYLVVRS